MLAPMPVCVSYFGEQSRTQNEDIPLEVPVTITTPIFTQYSYACTSIHQYQKELSSYAKKVLWGERAS
jgi:hypothetical protein